MPIFECATWRPVGNKGGAMSHNRGLLLHHAVANGSLYGFFNNPASQVSAHFWVSKSGLIEQYVDSSVVAWHAKQMNSSYCGVETEGCTTSPYAEPMTEAMIDALAILYAEGNRRHGWPNKVANKEGEDGFGYHRMGVNTGCPCDVRLSMRPEILSRAFGGTTPAPKPPEPPKPGVAAPPFPYPADHYLGQPSPDPKCHSGFYGGVDMSHVQTWQTRMAQRGWKISVDGMYGPQSYNVCISFQREKGLVADGLVGPQTWKATWESPIT